MMVFRDGMFQEVLKDCNIDEIREAFLEHVRRKSDLPTPSDIFLNIEEARKYKIYTAPKSIQTLLRYRQKGIRLRPEEETRLKNEGY